MKVKLGLYSFNGSAHGLYVDNQTIETIPEEASYDIIQALKAWTLGPGDTIKIEEVE